MTTHTRTFPGVAESVRAAREFTRAAFDAAGACYTGNAVLIVSELAANAIQHTASGNPGGTFTVTITPAPGTILLEVTDDGAAGHAVPLVPAQRPPLDPERGRGVWLAIQMSHAFGLLPGRARCSFDLTVKSAREAA